MTKKHKFLKDNHIWLIESAIEHKMFNMQRKGLRDLFWKIWPTFFQAHEYDMEDESPLPWLASVMEDRELP